MVYYRIYDELVRNFYHDKTDVEIQQIKDGEFAEWLKFYVSDSIESGRSLPTWLVEMCNGLNTVAASYPRFCCRGYAFRSRNEGRSRLTADYGVSATGGDVVYYGILNEILEVRYPGLLDLRCIVFMCDWYDPTIGNGVKIDHLGVISINSRCRLRTYDPFILASQADQVCYIPYPRVTYRTDPWMTVTQINPRGIIYGVSEEDAMQSYRSVEIIPTELLNDIDLVVDSTQHGDDIVHSDSEKSGDEFNEDSDSIPSDDSSGYSE